MRLHSGTSLESARFYDVSCSRGEPCGGGSGLLRAQFREGCAPGRDHPPDSGDETSNRFESLPEETEKTRIPPVIVPVRPTIKIAVVTHQVPPPFCCLRLRRMPACISRC